jgi:acetyl esterase/lipase
MECTGASIESRAAVDPVVQKEVLLQMGGAYLNGADPKSPLAAPLHADFAGLPPLLIQVGDAEVLLDDSTRIGQKLKAAGVDVTVEVWNDMIHVWHKIPFEDSRSRAPMITRLPGCRRPARRGSAAGNTDEKRDRLAVFERVVDEHPAAF